jgi:hypothetical protein
LIAAGTLPIKAEIQGACFLFCNISFLLLLAKLKPLVYFPCRHKEWNLFLLAEMLGAFVTILGNILAMIGSFSSQKVVNRIGFAFAIVNIAFAVAFSYAYGIEMNSTIANSLSLSAVMPVEGDPNVSHQISRARSRSTHEAIGSSVESAEMEWDTLLRLFEGAKTFRAKQKVKQGFNFQHSQVVTAVKTEIHKNFRDERKKSEYEALLTRIEEEFFIATNGELSKLNKQRIFWSYIFSLNSEGNLNLDGSFYSMMDEYFGKEHKVLKKIKRSGNYTGALKDYDEILSDYKNKTGWYDGSELFGFVRTLL